MDTIGVPSLTLESTTGIEGECALCPTDLLAADETFVFSDKEPIAALHKECFWHMSVVMHEYFVQFGLPTSVGEPN